MAILSSMTNFHSSILHLAQRRLECVDGWRQFVDIRRHIFPYIRSAHVAAATDHLERTARLVGFARPRTSSPTPMTQEPATLRRPHRPYPSLIEQHALCGWHAPRSARLAEGAAGPSGKTGAAGCSQNATPTQLPFADEIVCHTVSPVP